MTQSKQSPEYQDAAAILEEIGKLEFAHSRTLALMNWKLQGSPQQIGESRCGLCKCEKSQHIPDAGKLACPVQHMANDAPINYFRELRDSEAPRQPSADSGLTWAEETMQIINNLTPDIKGKAFDPDWFLLRERLESFEAELRDSRQPK